MMLKTSPYGTIPILIMVCYQNRNVIISDIMSSKKEEKPTLMFFQRQINYRERKKEKEMMEAKVLAKKDMEKAEKVKKVKKTRDKLRYLVNTKIPKIKSDIEDVKSDQKRASSKKKKSELRVKFEALKSKLKLCKNEENKLKSELLEK